VSRPEVLSISRVSLDGGRAVLSARPSILVCGPKVANDGYHVPASGAARTYRLAPQATVVLIDMSDGLVPAHYSAVGFAALLARPRLSLERGELDPYFRNFRTALATPADGAEITTLAQLYNPCSTARSISGLAFRLHTRPSIFRTLSALTTCCSRPIHIRLAQATKVSNTRPLAHQASATIQPSTLRGAPVPRSSAGVLPDTQRRVRVDTTCR
jgi:hypothetical protein